MKTLFFLPDGSLVGILLFYQKYNYFKDSGLAYQKHYHIVC